MSVGMKTSRAQMWLDSLGEWSWPGRSAEAVESLPPSWVPVFPPPRLEPIAPAVATPGLWQPARALPRGFGRGAFLSGLAAVCAMLALNGPTSLERLAGLRTAEQVVPALTSTAPTAQPLPTLNAASQDAAGSSIDAPSYPSVALHEQGSFLVYLP